VNKVYHQKADLQAKRGTKTYDNARHMNVQHSLPRVVRPVDLNEVGLEVIGNSLIFIRSFAIRRDAVKKVVSMSGRSWKHETDGRTIWKLGFPVLVSSSADRFYLCPIVSVQRS